MFGAELRVFLPETFSILEGNQKTVANKDIKTGWMSPDSVWTVRTASLATLTSGSSSSSSNSGSCKIWTELAVSVSPGGREANCRLILAHSRLVVEVLSDVPEGDLIVLNKDYSRDLLRGFCPLDYPIDLSTPLFFRLQNQKISSDLIVRTGHESSDSGCEDDLILKTAPKKDPVRSKKLLSCNFCEKMFDRPSLLARHTRTHTGDRPYRCQDCGKTFSTSSSLNTHTRIHSGERPHQCLICLKRFTASSNLYYHKWVHSARKPHACRVCEKGFTTPGDLRCHMYTHTGEWPYTCTHCSRGFAKITQYRNHMINHV